MTVEEEQGLQRTRSSRATTPGKNACGGHEGRKEDAILGHTCMYQGGQREGIHDRERVKGACCGDGHKQWT